MSYTSRKGRRPTEYASKSSHTNIINDPDVAAFLQDCSYPKSSEDIIIDPNKIHKVKTPDTLPVKNVVAIDGGRTTVPVKREFPSSIVIFYQFGALYFKFEDLENLYQQPFIEPSDISKLKEIQRYKYILPTKNVKISSSTTLLDSVRKSLSDFFIKKQPGGDRFIDSLKWLIFEEFSNKPVKWNLASCPGCGERDITLSANTISNDYTFSCPKCQGIIYLTDVFRFHEVIDNEIGAGGIESYLGSVFEQIVLVHLIRIILNTKPAILNETIFLKDGQLAFFGQTANLFRPMLNLVHYLQSKYSFYLIGLEKSGAFVENADEISARLKSGTAFILNNDYIYKYVIPGKSSSGQAYGSTTYYGSKLYYKAEDGRLYVATLPTKTAKLSDDPKIEDFPHLDVILSVVSKLKCDMYDSSLIPISLVNKLVSLSNHPSSVILEKFAKKSVHSS